MLWNHWAAEWLLYEKVSFNGTDKIIYVHPDVTTLDIRVDVWSAFVRWRAAGNDHFLEAMRRTGYDLLPGGQRTGDSYFLINGWKFYCNLETVKISGVMFSDEFDTAYYDIDTGNAVYPVEVSAKVNTVIVNTGVGSVADVASAVWNAIQSNYNTGGSMGAALSAAGTAGDPWISNLSTYNTAGTAGKAVKDLLTQTDTLETSATNILSAIDAIPTAIEVADAVRTELTPELTHTLLMENGLTATQATMLTEIYALYGLDPTKPLVVTDTNRSAGSGISQTISSGTSITTVTRVP